MDFILGSILVVGYVIVLFYSTLNAFRVVHGDRSLSALAWTALWLALMVRGAYNLWQILFD